METDTSYNINESPISVSESNDIKLLVDTLTTNDSITEQLEEAATSALTAAGIDTTDLTFTQFRYLDLVDNANGNAYVTLANPTEDSVNIYWPNPDEDSEAYYVIHFDGLSRDFEISNLNS